MADADDLKEALQELLFSSTGRLALFFEREFRRAVGRSTYLAATLDALAEGPATVTEVASRIRTSSGATVTYLDRLKDLIQRNDGRYALLDPVLGLWLKWKRPGGTVVPMSVVGDEGEQTTARALSAMGFDLIYQSRASRGAFDLLATRGAMQLGVQVKRSALPLRFTKQEWHRMEAAGERAAIGNLLKWMDSRNAPEKTPLIIIQNDTEHAQAKVCRGLR